MKRFTIAALLLVVAFFGLIGFSNRPVQAQDSGMHTCDSTLIALLYVAEYDYGFKSMMDTATFDKGQYAPLFDAMMADMADGGDMMATEDPMMMATQDPMMMSTEEPMMATQDAMMTTLMPATVAGEDEACTALRTELDTFLLKALKEEMKMDMDAGE